MHVGVCGGGGYTYVGACGWVWRRWVYIHRCMWVGVEAYLL